MTVKVVTWVFHESPVGGGQRLILLAIADEANHDGYCYPGHALLAEKSRISVRTSIRMVEALEDRGELLVHRRRAQRQSNEYVVVMGRDIDALRARYGWPESVDSAGDDDASHTSEGDNLAHGPSDRTGLDGDSRRDPLRPTASHVPSTTRDIDPCANGSARPEGEPSAPWGWTGLPDAIREARKLVRP